VFEGWDPQDEGRREALCTLGNGRFATRGAAPESVADGVHYPGTYAAGCYNRLRDEIDGQIIENESMVNLPNWLDLRFAVDDGDQENPEWVDLSRVQVLQHKVELDLRRGLLHRKLRFTDAAGRTTSVRQRRFVHMGQSQLAGLHSVFTAENWSGRLLVASGIDGSVTNAGVPRYAGMAARHLDVVELREIDPLTVLLVARTTQSELCIAEAVRTTVCRGGIVDDVPAPAAAGTGAHRASAGAGAAGRKPVAVEKIASLVTSRDVGISAPAVAAAESLADAPPFERLLQTHELAWHQLWRRIRLQLRDGHGPATTETLRTVRLSVFHLLQSVSPHNIDLDAGIPARGLHGEAYRGHVIWDELFVFPVLTLRLLTLRLPGLARALLRYRTRRLDAARRAAKAAGYTGAMYPWQSGSDGREESQRVHLNPLSGRWLTDTSHLQRHVGLAVAYNIWQYYPGHRRPRAPRRPRRGDDAGDRSLLRRPRRLRRRPRPVPDPRRDGARRVQHPLSRRRRAGDRRQRLHQRDDRLVVVARAGGARCASRGPPQRAGGTAGARPDRAVALARCQQADLRSDRPGRRDQPVRGLPRPGRTRLDRLPPALRRHPAARPTAEGVHLGAMAGCRPAATLLRRTRDTAWRSPVQPALAARVREVGVRGAVPRAVTVLRVSGRQVRVGAEAGPGRVVRVGCGDEVRELPRGETVVFVAAGAGKR
jgi:hypothetical protein